MNAFAMKLESRQQLAETNEEKLNDLTKRKKCKSVKKKNISTCDKDASLNNHGLGRKFSDDSDSSAQNLNPPPKYEISKKNRSKKVSPKVDKMFSESDKIQERLQRSLSNEDKEKVVSILNEIRTLSDVEKLYLYLQLPTGSPFEVDPLKQKTLNPLGKKADEEGMFAITWIQSHLEEDPDVSLPKQEVYDEYQSYCTLAGTDPLCAADFGKVMKQIFPSVKPRRLGTRGNSRYCYSGLRKKVNLQSPSIPDIQKEKEKCSSDESYRDEVTAAACHLLFEWAEKLLGIKFSSLKDLAAHLLENMYVDNRSVAAFTVLLDASPQLLSKGFSANEGGVKKTEAQFHLQRKIQEKELIKEQKRKLQEQRSSIVTANKGKTTKKKNLKSRKSRASAEEDILVEDEEKLEINLPEQRKNKNKNNENGELKKGDEIVFQDTKREVVSSEGTSSEMYEISELSIKNEESFSKIQPEEIAKDIAEQSLILASPVSSPIDSINDIEDSSKRKDRITMPQNKPPVCIAQSLPGIIIVPSLPQIAAEIKQNTNTPKYKRIQPKPLQGEVIFRSRAGSVGSSVSGISNIRSVDGRRSSHAWLQSDSLVERDEKLVRNSTPFKSVQEKRNTLKDNVRFETPHGNKPFGDSLLERKKKITELQRPKLIIQSNIQTNSEADDNNCFKRHLDENDEHTDNKRFHLDISKLSVDVNNLSNAQAASKKYIGGVDNEEVNVREIEGDALNDYFRGANNHNTSLQQNDLEQQISSSNKVKQLSQLRMLLEQNLPSAISKMSPSSIKVQKVSKSSDENENVLATLSRDLKKPFLPVLQHDTQRNLQSNVIVENAVNQTVIINGNTELKDDPQIDNLDKLLSSSYLTSDSETNMSSHLLSDPSVFLNCSQNSVQDMDVSLHNELNQNSSTNDILLFQTLMSNTELVDDQINATIPHGRINTCTQVPSVPQSPNTRRRAFNFMPISPRHTPIPDGVSTHETSSIASSPHLRTMISTGVGPSQPPSNSGSPFVSPRSTPVPLCRSRHSSGQSTYSTSRHTPFQNFDSGVSSVSSSPFISPQPTPVPVSRLRHNSNHGSSKTVTFSSINCPQVIHAHSALSNMPQLRIRHNSGPGGAHVPTTSPSPLITELTPAQSFMFPSRTEVRSRHNSGSNATTPLSPVSEQASSSSSCASNMPDLSAINDTALSHSFLNDGAGDILISANPSSFKQVRHRHVSGSVIYGKSSYSQRDFFSQEIQKLLKNNQDNATSDLMLSNRSQSVPLHQMLQTADGFCFLSQPFEESCPKSHPSTPVMNQIFSFPSVGSNPETASLSLAVDMANREKSSVIQNSQMDWTGFENSADIEASSSARRNLTALYDAAPLSDDLQTTLEDLRDCDTVFSKLELELRQSEESGL